MPVTHGSQVISGLTRIPESAYGSPTADGVGNFVRLLLTERSMAKHTPGIKNNKGYANGSMFPNEQWIINNDIDRTLPFELSFNQLGRYLYLMNGADTISTPTGFTAAGAKRHTFQLMSLASSRQLPPYGLVEQSGSNRDRYLVSVVGEKFHLEGKGTDRVSGSIAVRGSGKINLASGISIPAFDPHVYGMNSQAVITLDDGSTVVNYASSQRESSWSFDQVNTFVPGYRPGQAAFQTSGNQDSGAVRTECLLDDVSYDMSFSVRLGADSAERAALLAQTKFIFKIVITGPTISGAIVYAYTITVPVVSVRDD
jgi:hypothetical protein